MDWVLPTDEILARVEMMAAEEHKASVPAQTSNGNGGPSRRNKRYNGIASQLRKFALHLKGRS